MNQRVIINKDGDQISVINPKTKKLELAFRKSVGKDIKDFRVFGEQDTRVVAMTKDGYVLLYSLGDFSRRGLVAHYQEELIEEKYEQTKSIAVCDKNEYVLLEIAASGYSSRMIILKLTLNTITKVTSIDQYSHKIEGKCALEFYSYFGKNHSLWVGLSGNYNGPVQIFDYDAEKEELRELVDKRVSHQENGPLKLHRVDENFYYTGFHGKLMCLRIRI